MARLQISRLGVVTILLGIWLSLSFASPWVSAQAPVLSSASLLPPGLAEYRYDPSVGDYLDQIWHNEQGEYVRWTQYPVQVYIRPEHPQWTLRIRQALRQWMQYVPMQLVDSEEQAQITVERVPQTESYSGKAKAAFDVAATGELQHRVAIRIYKYLSLPEVRMVALHEIGHALGLWGHSLEPRDLMFGGDPSSTSSWQPDLRTIGPRDLNTLKRLYEQPSVIGMEVSNLVSDKNDPTLGPDRSVIPWEWGIGD